MSAKNLKPSVLIDIPKRCQVCGTSLTHYPLDYKMCEKCGKTVCRQCWGETWPGKSFSAESCKHMDKSHASSVSPVAQKINGPGFDWPKTLVTATVVVVVVVLVVFLWDLLAF